LPVHDVELLLQRHLRKAGTAGAQRRADDSAGGRADPGATAGIAVPAAAADGGAESRSEGCGKKCGPHCLIGGGVGLGCGLRRGILLAVRLLAGESFEALIRSRGHRNRRHRGRCDACAQSDHQRRGARKVRTDMLHVAFPSMDRIPIDVPASSHPLRDCAESRRLCQHVATP
jgi:hypothetical protein